MFLNSLPFEHRNIYARHIYNCLKINGRIDRLPKFGDGSDCGIDGTATGNSDAKSATTAAATGGAGTSAGGARRRRQTHRRRKSSRKVRV